MLGPGEIEGRPLVGLGVEPRSPAACLDDLAHDRKSYARPLDLVAGRERLEDLPDLLAVLRGNPRTIIGDGEPVELAFLVRGDFDPRVRTSRVLDRVPDEVHENLLEGHA